MYKRQDVTITRIYDSKEDIPECMKGNKYVLTREDVIKSFISYAIGCMFGRYSLDEEGLIYAGGDFDDKFRLRSGQWEIKTKDCLLYTSYIKYTHVDLKNKIVSMVFTDSPYPLLGYNIDYLKSRRYFPFGFDVLFERNKTKDLRKLKNTNNIDKKQEAKYVFDWVKNRVLNNYFSVNNAWMAIIKYLPKIDTSKVMFSIFVGIAHRSAIYFNILNLREKYNVVRINDISVVGDDDECVGEDLFVSTVANNSLSDNYKTKDVEDIVLNKMNIEEKFYLETNHSTDDIERIIESIEEDNNINYLQENILAYSFNILSGKMKKLCFEKIFAEFFNDLINSNIPEKVINKHTPTLVEVMNLVTLDPSLVDNTEYNNKVYKLFKDWLKEKIRTKLYKYNIKITNDMDEFKREQALELVKRENRMLKYIKDNKNDFMKKLLEFKDNCVNFRV